MTENKEIIKAGGVFITHRTREAIYATAAQRTEPELKECFTMLHDSMDRFGKQIAVEEITGQDFIIYTPERRIGKTEAALYLAHEYNMPYLVKLAQLDFVKRQAKEAGYNIKFVPLSRPQIEGMRLRTIRCYYKKPLPFGFCNVHHIPCAVPGSPLSCLRCVLYNTAPPAAPTYYSRFYCNTLITPFFRTSGHKNKAAISVWKMPLLNRWFLNCKYLNIVKRTCEGC